MSDPTLAQAIIASTLVLAAAWILARVGRALIGVIPTIMEFLRYLADRVFPKPPETITAEAIAQAAIEPIEVGRLISVCNEAILKHDELIELNRKDIDIILQRESTKDAMLNKLNAPTLKPHVPTRRR